jgi:hypothetical protein
LRVIIPVGYFHMDKLPSGAKLPRGVKQSDVDKFVAEHERKQREAAAQQQQPQDDGLPDFDAIFRDDSYGSLPPYMKTCAFGPTFFDGVKWGAAVTFFPTVLLARRSYRLARINMPNKAIRLHQYDPWSALFIGACGITACIKAGKFVLARGRVREFQFEEEYAIATATDEELETMATMKVLRDFAAQGESVFDALDDDEDGNGKRRANDNHREEEEEDYDALVKRQDRQRRLGGRDIGNKAAKLAQMPTWWDGFAVGVYGSLIDAHIPINPPSMYTGLRAGRSMSVF